MSQISRIRELLKRVGDSVIRERLLMIQESYGDSFRFVGKTYGCSDGKVRYWRRRFEAGGRRGLQTKQYPGRPPKISKESSLKIKHIVRRHNVKQGWTTKRIRELIYAETGVQYSERQVIRITQSWGLSKIKPRPRYAYSKQEDREAFLKKTVVY